MSVAARSPLRYPGGKSWLVSLVCRWLVRGARPALFCEPFAGGASVGLEVATADLAERVVLVERDPDVAALWSVCTSPAWEVLVKRILEVPQSAEGLAAVLAAHPAAGDAVGRSLRVLVANRVAYGGVLAPGAGRLRRGEGGRGFTSRWYPATLVQRIRAIAALASAGRLTFAEGDGLRWLMTYASDALTTFFVDPPYAAGRRLYGPGQGSVAPEHVFALCASLQGRFLLCYDDGPKIRGLAARHAMALSTVPMRTTHHVGKRELLMSKSGDEPALCPLFDGLGHAQGAAR